MTLDEMALTLAIELIRKSGVREWDDDQSEIRQKIAAASLEMAVAMYTGEFDMVSKILVQEMDGTPKQICFADHAGDFNPANDLRASTDGSLETDCQITLASLANAAGRQSAKVDLGENRADEYKVRAAFEIAATPTAGLTIDLYWAPSWSATAGTGNPGNVTGSDAAYAGYSANLSETLLQLEFIGSFICTVQATGTVQYGEVAVFSPGERYGSLIVVDNSGAALHSDDVESHIVFDPIVPEQQ